MKALLWKEMRLLGPAAAAVLGLLLVLLLARQDTGFNALLSSSLKAYLPLLCWASALVLGLSALAGERSQGTLAFLLGRPLAVGKLLGVLIGVRLAVLLAVVALAAAVLCAAPLDSFELIEQERQRLARDNRILEAVGYAPLAYLWAMYACALFAYGLAASAIAGDMTRAAVMALVAIWAGEMMTFVLYKVSDVFVLYRDYLQIGFDEEGSLIQLARSPDLLAWYGVYTGVQALLGLGLARWAAPRFKAADSGSSWPVVAVLCLVGLMPLVFILLNPVGFRSNARVDPVALLPYKESARDLALRDGQVFVVVDSALSAVDATDWRKPREVARAAAPGWRFKQMALAGQRAYAWGHWGAGDSAAVGLAYFDISRLDQPQLAGQVLVQELIWRERVREEPRYHVYQQAVPLLLDLAAQGQRLYAGVVDERYVELLGWDLAGETPRLLWRHRIADIADWGPEPDFGLRLRGDQAFFSRHGELAIWDLKPMDGPVELNRTLIQSVPWVTDIADPLLMLDGDRVYLRRSWPQEVAVLDVSNPRAPVEVEPVLWEKGYNQDAQTDGNYIYDKDWTALEIYKIGSGGVCLEQTELSFAGKFRQEDSSEAQIILTDEYICTLLSNNLVFYEPLPGD